MSQELLQLQDMCGKYTILYAEDDAQTQEVMAVILRRIFKEVYVADDGAMGYELFKKHAPNLVITDIQMPKKNGLEMAKAIKELAPATPIIISTAFNEERYFLGAIESGVDAFLFKPIDRAKLFQTLFKTVSLLAYTAKAQELEALKKIHEINQASEESIQNLSNLFPFPALFYKDNALIFVNAEARKTFEKVALESIAQETVFVSRFNILKDKKQKIKLPTASGLHRIYWLYPNALFVGVDLTLVQAYIFMDITMMEYQKLRLNAYTLPALKQRQADALSETPLSTLEPHVSAKALLETLEPLVLDGLEEIRELQDFVLSFAYDYQAKPHDALRAKLAEIYLCYATMMQKLKVFDPVAEALKEASNLLVRLQLDHRTQQKLSLFLLSLSEELHQWCTALFITKDASNIHAFDDAIIASCLQMEAELTGTHDCAGDDLELSQ
jgi:CheY-like chemotaxis protein